MAKMTSRRCAFAALLLIAAPLGAAAETVHRVSVSQFVEHPALDAVLKGFQDGLEDSGVSAQFTVHNAQANMAIAGQIAGQIMGEDPDLILAIATPTAQAVAQALRKAPHLQKIPFLFTAITDPVGAGLVSNLERPGGNITGVSDLLPLDQHLAMVMDFIPGLGRLGVLYNAGEANSQTTVEGIRRIADAKGFAVFESTVSKSSDVYQAAQSLVGRVDAVFIPTDNTVVSALESAVKVGVDHRMPIFCADVDSVKRGAVAAMGFDYYQHGRQTAAMAVRIFQGADPALTPVETQKTLELHINQTFAEKMGISIPEALLKRADKVYR